MDFIRGQNTPYFSWDFDSKIWFRARKVTGTFEKRAPGQPGANNGYQKFERTLWGHQCECIRDKFW